MSTCSDVIVVPLCLSQSGQYPMRMGEPFLCGASVVVSFYCTVVYCIALYVLVQGGIIDCPSCSRLWHYAPVSRKGPSIVCLSRWRHLFRLLCRPTLPRPWLPPSLGEVQHCTAPGDHARTIFGVGVLLLLRPCGN